jgi:hypothetical protein
MHHGQVIICLEGLIQCSTFDRFRRIMGQIVSYVIMIGRKHILYLQICELKPV